MARVHASMLVATVLIATSFPVAEAVAGHLDSRILTMLRFGGAALLFLPLSLRYPRSALVPKLSSLVRYAVLSAPLVGYFVAMFEALETTSAVNTGALFTLGPVFASLFSWWLEGKRVSGRTMLALATGILGAVWVVFRGDPARITSLDLTFGDALFVGGTALFGLYVVLVRYLHRGEPMAIMTFWTLVTGCGWLALLSARDLAAISFSTVELPVFAAVLYLSLFATLFSFMLTQRAVQVLGPTRTMSYTYLNPMLVALWSSLFGREALGLQVVPGMVLTILSLLILQGPSQPKAALASLPNLAANGRSLSR